MQKQSYAMKELKILLSKQLCHLRSVTIKFFELASV